jgi:5S rRNA maturation endonuclease (ribonuclease M5)
METNGIERFLTTLGIEESRVAGDWINFRCPLVHNHEPGTDRKAAGISISESKSVFHCFTCTSKAIRLERLLYILWVNGENTRPAAEVLARFEDWSREDDDLIIPPDKPRTNGKREVLPDGVIDHFPLLVDAPKKFRKEACDYLLMRGSSIQAARRYGIRAWPNKDALVFPLTDRAGRPVVLRVRKLFEKKCWTVTPEHVGMDRKFPTLAASGPWFGLSLINWSKPVWIVEGEEDALRLETLGQSNVLASAGTGVTRAQLSNLTGADIVIGMDADKAGQRAAQRVLSLIGDSAVCWKADWSKFGCKDPRDIPNKKTLEEVKKRLQLIKQF